MDDCLRFVLDELAIDGEGGATPKRFWQIVGQYWDKLGVHQNVDDAYRNYFWKLLLERPEFVPCHQTSEGKLLPCKQDLSTWADCWTRHGETLRLCVSEECLWQALTGHGPDYARVQPMMLTLLSAVSRARENGIMLIDLYTSTGQDKRSAPGRCKKLADLGLIIGTSVIMQRARTMHYRHWRYSKVPTTELENADLNLSAFRLSMIEALKQRNGHAMKSDDLRVVLGCSTKKAGDVRARAYNTTLAALAEHGYIELCKTRTGLARNNEPILSRVVTLIKDYDPAVADKEDWRGVSLAIKDEVDEDEANDILQGDERVPLPAEPAILQSSSSDAGLRKGEVPEATVVEAIARSGTDGVSSADVVSQITGSRYTRAAEWLLRRLLLVKSEDEYMAEYSDMGICEIPEVIGRTRQSRYFSIMNVPKNMVQAVLPHTPVSPRAGELPPIDYSRLAPVGRDEREMEVDDLELSANSLVVSSSPSALISVRPRGRPPGKRSATKDSIAPTTPKRPRGRPRKDAQPMNIALPSIEPGSVSSLAETAETERSAEPAELADNAKRQEPPIVIDPELFREPPMADTPCHTPTQVECPITNGPTQSIDAVSPAPVEADGDREPAIPALEAVAPATPIRQHFTLKRSTTPRSSVRNDDRTRQRRDELLDYVEAKCQGVFSTTNFDRIALHDYQLARQKTRPDKRTIQTDLRQLVLDGRLVEYNVTMQDIMAYVDLRKAVKSEASLFARPDLSRDAAIGILEMRWKNREEQALQNTGTLETREIEGLEVLPYVRRGVQRTEHQIFTSVDNAIELERQRRAEEVRRTGLKTRDRLDSVRQRKPRETVPRPNVTQANMPHIDRDVQRRVAQRRIAQTDEREALQRDQDALRRAEKQERAAEREADKEIRLIEREAERTQRMAEREADRTRRAIARAAARAALEARKLKLKQERKTESQKRKQRASLPHAFLNLSEEEDDDEDEDDDDDNNDDDDDDDDDEEDNDDDDDEDQEDDNEDETDDIDNDSPGTGAQRRRGGSRVDRIHASRAAGPSPLARARSRRPRAQKQDAGRYEAGGRSDTDSETDRRERTRHAGPPISAQQEDRLLRAAFLSQVYFQEGVHNKRANIDWHAMRRLVPELSERDLNARYLSIRHRPRTNALLGFINSAFFAERCNDAIEQGRLPPFPQPGTQDVDLSPYVEFSRLFDVQQRFAVGHELPEDPDDIEAVLDLGQEESQIFNRYFAFGSNFVRMEEIVGQAFVEEDEDDEEEKETRNDQGTSEADITPDLRPEDGAQGSKMERSGNEAPEVVHVRVRAATKGMLAGLGVKWDYKAARKAMLRTARGDRQLITNVIRELQEDQTLARPSRHIGDPVSAGGTPSWVFSDKYRAFLEPVIPIAALHSASQYSTQWPQELAGRSDPIEIPLTCGRSMALAAIEMLVAGQLGLATTTQWSLEGLLRGYHVKSIDGSRTNRTNLLELPMQDDTATSIAWREDQRQVTVSEVVRAWRVHGGSGPSLLVGVDGKPDEQMIQKLLSKVMGMFVERGAATLNALRSFMAKDLEPPELITLIDVLTNVGVLRRHEETNRRGRCSSYYRLLPGFFRVLP
ncbi:hypothetical protein PYCC9005_001185 [Savitreella phatthalungensis]